MIPSFQRRAIAASTVCFFFLSLRSLAFAQAEIDLTLRDGQIVPALFAASLEKEIVVRVTNRGTKPHNLVIPDFFIFTNNLQPGEDVVVRFTPDKTGSYPYFSDFGGKPELGMQGTLQVN